MGRFYASLSFTIQTSGIFNSKREVEESPNSLKTFIFVKKETRKSIARFSVCMFGEEEQKLFSFLSIESCAKQKKRKFIL